MPWSWIDRLLAVAAVAMAVVSYFLNDLDKSPLYLLIAYALLRLSAPAGGRAR